MLNRKRVLDGIYVRQGDAQSFSQPAVHDGGRPHVSFGITALLAWSSLAERLWRAVRLFGPELSRLPAGLFVGLARWLAAPPACVDTCARGGNQLTLQARGVAEPSHPL